MAKKGGSVVRSGPPGHGGDPDKIREMLAAPFPEAVVSWKPQTVSGNRALAVAYIDARDVMNRLDEVFGVGGWQDTYTPLPDGNVQCRLSILVGGVWVPREDVGGESDQRDSGDKTKAAFSDALKRAAVKFGVGRYIYSLPLQWVDYDPTKKQFVGTPRLPDWAKPASSAAQAPAAAPQAQERPALPAPQESPKAQAMNRLYESLMEAIARAATPQALEEVRLKVVDAAKHKHISPGQIEALKLAGQQRRATLQAQQDDDPERAAIQGEPSLLAEREPRLKVLLAAKGCAWASVLSRCGLPSEAEPGDLRQGEWDAAEAFLQGLPDVKPAKGGR